MLGIHFAYPADVAAAQFLDRRNIYAAFVPSVDGTLVIGFWKDGIDALLGIGP